MAKQRLHVWGNSQDGQLGIGTSENVLLPTPLDFPEHKTIESVASGPSHTLLVDSEGLVYSFGNNDHGQLGHHKRRMRPEVVDALEVFRVKQVACGSAHTLALTYDGQVLSWGLNDRGQLGHGLDAVGTTGKPKFIKAFASDRIVQIASGAKHCLALGEDGKVWAWGENSSGQLGNGTFVFAHTPFVINSLHGRPIKKLACGSNHSLALSVSGRIYSWGENDFGQLGTGDTTKLLRPQVIKAASAFGVLDIACGENHSAYATKAGKVFTFGAGSNGQLGHQGTNHELSPKCVASLEAGEDILVACGRRHTLVYHPTSRHLYSFGLNGSGQLGQSIGGDKGTSSPFAIKSLDGARINSIVCGGDQSFCLVSTENSSPASLQPQDSPLPANSIFYLNSAIIKHYLEVATVTQNYGPLQHLVGVVFSSASCLNASFLSKDHYETSDTVTGIDFEDLAVSLNLLFHSDKVVVNTIGNALSKLVVSLQHFQTGLAECMRVFMHLLLNPLLSDPSIYHIVCQKVISLVVGFPEKIKGVLEQWFSRMAPREFTQILQVFQNSLSFLVGTESRLSLDTTVTSCCLSLRWLFSINNTAHIVPPRMFYNSEVSRSIDIQEDYIAWLTQKNQFSFCQFPFLLDLKTKISILHIDARRQMADEVNHFIQQTFSNIQIPPEGDAIRIDANPFLLITVRRSHLVSDTLAQLSKFTVHDLKRPLVVQFEGEEGQDEGGLRKEFFGLIAQHMVDPSNNLFETVEESRLLWFKRDSGAPENISRLLGTLVGLAIYNGCLIDLPFPLLVYKKLLGLELTLKDFSELHPGTGENLQKLLDAKDEGFEETFGLTFQIQEERDGKVVSVDLKPNGGSIPVTMLNRQEFVNLYVEHTLVKSVAKQFNAFSQGFKSICDGPIYKLFQLNELDILVRGNPNFNFVDLGAAAIYSEGYHKDHPVIKNFWTVFHSMPTSFKKRFLVFLTGMDRVPPAGLGSLRFVIQQVKDTTRLPAAHTCFNILDLPCYETMGELQEKLVYAITNTEGFGLV